MDSLLLDTALWDLVVDASGNIAVASDPYAIAQNVASACRTFIGECWYDTTIGIPYFEQILGHAPPLGLFKAQLVKAALTVPGCFNPVVFISSFEGRKISGQVQFTDSSGTRQTVGF